MQANDPKINQIQQLLAEITWLPKHQVRISTKAKHLQLRFKLVTTLEIVVPPRCSINTVLNFIIAQQRWILKHRVNLPVEPIEPNIVPMLSLSSIDQTWHLVFNTQASCVKLTADYTKSTCYIYTKQQNHKVIKALVYKWLKIYAKRILSQKLAVHAQIMGVIFNTVKIRGQTTIWGSCASNGNISLNYKLIFLPKAVCDYVLVHELCHLKHLNHSNRFWNMVKKYQPDYQEHKKELLLANKYIPEWLHH